MFPAALAHRSTAITSHRRNTSTVVALDPGLLSAAPLMSNAAWIKEQVAVTTGFTGVNGGATAEALMETATTNIHQITSGVITKPASVGQYEFKGRFKANGRDNLTVVVYNGQYSLSAAVRLDLTTGVASFYYDGSGWINDNVDSVSLGNGWYELDWLYTADAVADMRIQFIIENPFGTDNYAGSASAGILTDGFRSALASSEPAAEPAPLRSFYLDNTHASRSDSNPGTDPNLPKATITGINNLSLLPGDAVYIKAGTTYNGTTLLLNESGNSTNRILFSMYGSGAKPVITHSGSPCVQGANCSYVTVEKLNLQGANYSGIQIDNGINNIIRYNEISNVGLCVNLGADSTKVYNNYLHDGKMVVNTQGGDDDYGANGIFLDAVNTIEIYKNKMVNLKAPSFDYGYDGGGVELWKGCSNVTIRENWFDTCVGVVECGSDNPADTASNVEIYGNVSINCGGMHYLHNGSGSGFTMMISNFKIHHNTIIEESGNGWIFGFNQNPSGTGYESYRNIVYAPTYTSVYGYSVGNNTGATDYHHDNFYQTGNPPLGGVNEANGTVAFVNRAGRDFHITPGGAGEAYGAYVVANPTSSDPTV